MKRIEAPTLEAIPDDTNGTKYYEYTYHHRVDLVHSVGGKVG